MLRERIQGFFGQEAQKEPETYTNVRWIDMEDLVASIYSDDGDFTINNVTDLTMAKLSKAEIEDFDYNSDELMFHVKFKNPVTVLAERGRTRRGMWVRLLVF